MQLAEFICFIYIGISVEDAVLDHWENVGYAFLLLVVFILARILILLVFGLFYRKKDTFHIYGLEWVGLLFGGVIKGPMTFIFANVIVISKIACIDRHDLKAYNQVRPLYIIQLAVIFSLVLGCPINYLVAKLTYTQSESEGEDIDTQMKDFEEVRRKYIQNDWKLDILKPRAFQYTDEFVLKPFFIRDYFSRKQYIYGLKTIFEQDEAMYSHGHGDHGHDDHGHGGGHDGGHGGHGGGHHGGGHGGNDHGNGGHGGNDHGAGGNHGNGDQTNRGTDAGKKTSRGGNEGEYTDQGNFTQHSGMNNPRSKTSSKANYRSSTQTAIEKRNLAFDNPNPTAESSRKKPGQPNVPNLALPKSGMVPSHNNSSASQPNQKPSAVSQATPPLNPYELKHSQQMSYPQQHQTQALQGQEHELQPHNSSQSPYNNQPQNPSNPPTPQYHLSQPALHPPGQSMSGAQIGKILDRTMVQPGGLGQYEGGKGNAGLKRLLEYQF